MRIFLSLAGFGLLLFTSGCDAREPGETLGGTSAQTDNTTISRSKAMQGPDDRGDVQRPTHEDTLVLGAGCFWCVEAVFERLEGVTDVQAGYAGGHVDDPEYEAVCAGSTGHAEVARITYDPDVISISKILSVFWIAHDPTTLNRQGADIGTQYRSAIFYRNEQQRAAAEKSLAEAQSRFSADIVTEVTPLDRFWAAESYHQDYYRNNRNAPYCRVVIEPKLKKLNLE